MLDNHVDLGDREMSLSFEVRKEKILKALELKGKVRVQEMAEALQVSSETIRRDLEKLEKEGALKKVYGGAVKSKLLGELPFEQKVTINQREKRAICRAAASLVEHGDIIMIGHGTTVLEIVHFLGDKQNVTIVTPSIPVLLLAMEVFKGKIIFIGGELEPQQKLMFGPLSERMLEQIKVNKAFIAAAGISFADGITDYDLHSASISRKMMERAEEAIVLADHTRFGKTAFAHICRLTDPSMLITDQGCSEEWRKVLNDLAVETILAEV